MACGLFGTRTSSHPQSDPQQVLRQHRQEYQARRSEPETVDTLPPETARPVEVPDLDWRERLLKVVRAVAPDQFERLAMRLLREAGFTQVVVTGRSGDGGIDGTAARESAER